MTDFTKALEDAEFRCTALENHAARIAKALGDVNMETWWTSLMFVGRDALRNGIKRVSFLGQVTLPAPTASVALGVRNIQISTSGE